MNERKKGAILSYIQVFLSVVVSMIYVPVLLHFLGQSEYGLYQIVGSFFSYVTVFESCVSAGILRNYCNALGRSDHEEAAVTLSMARSIYRFLAIILDNILWIKGSKGRTLVEKRVRCAAATPPAEMPDAVPDA